MLAQQKRSGAHQSRYSSLSGEHGMSVTNVMDIHRIVVETFFQTKYKQNQLSV